MSKFEVPSLSDNLSNKLKKTAVYGAMALGSAACAPGSGETSSPASAYEGKVEISQDNSPESVRETLLKGRNTGLNDYGNGEYSLVAIGRALDPDTAEDNAKSEIQQMRMNNKGVVFLPVSGSSKIEKASDGFYYVLIEQKGMKE